MHITRLDVRDFRLFESESIEPVRGLNLVIGDNGSGKTTLLEAMHLLAYGRSFRGRVRDGLVRTGAPALEVFSEWEEASGLRRRKAGLRHGGQAWDGRLDGQPVGQLGDLCAALAVVTFEPGSHALVSGGGEPRRRYVDWGLFHVEPNFLTLWRRYARALKQRNSLLKQRKRSDEIDAWDRELVETGEPITELRQRYLERIQSLLTPLSGELAPRLGDARIVFQPGWRRSELPLADALLLARDRDLLTGFTSVGPHRADWRVEHAGLPGNEALSRGQAKITALCCVLAQAEQHLAATGEWPVVLLDDLASELDRQHQQRVLERLLAGQVQVFVTGTESPATFGAKPVGARVFHVEQGRVTAAPDTSE